MLTYQQYQKKRVELVKSSTDSKDYESSRKAHEDLLNLDDKWMRMQRNLILTNVRVPRLGDLEAHHNLFGTPICCEEQIPAAFICCGHMYYLHMEKIYDTSKNTSYLPLNMELRLVVTIKNAAEYTLEKGAMFTMEGRDFCMISDKDAIMMSGLKDLRSWTDTNYLWCNVTYDYIAHKHSNELVGATFVYEPESWGIEND